jgi:hypothetical protein
MRQFAAAFTLSRRAQAHRESSHQGVVRHVACMLTDAPVIRFDPIVVKRGFNEIATEE